MGKNTQLLRALDTTNDVAFTMRGLSQILLDKSTANMRDAPDCAELALLSNVAQRCAAKLDGAALRIQRVMEGKADA